MELDFALLALNAEQGQGGKLHIYGGAFDRIELSEIPGTIPPFMIVARFMESAGTAADMPLTLRVNNPIGETQDIGVSGVHFIEADGDRTALLLMQIQMRFLHAGRYNFELASGDRLLKSIPLTVSASAPEGAA